MQSAESGPSNNHVSTDKELLCTPLAQEVEWFIHEPEGWQFKSSLTHTHAEVSLGKILRPNLPQMAVLPVCYVIDKVLLIDVICESAQRTKMSWPL